MAERLGSPADLNFVVQRLNDDGQPSTDLATSADIGEPVNNFPGLARQDRRRPHLESTRGRPLSDRPDRPLRHAAGRCPIHLLPAA